jgi:hypothetical protein
MFQDISRHELVASTDLSMYSATLQYLCNRGNKLTTVYPHPIATA